MIFATEPYGVGVLLNDGTGHLGSPVVSPVTVEPGWIESGWLDEDEWVDVAVIASDPPAVEVLLGQGDGSFLSNGVIEIDPAPSDVVLKDLSGDQLDDLAVTHGGTVDSVVVRLNRGFGEFAREQRYPVGDDPQKLVISLLGDDTLVDLAVSYRTSPGELSVLLGAGEGTFDSEVRYPTTADHGDALAADDLNRDGRNDLITLGWNGEAWVGVALPGTGDGTLGPAVTIQDAFTNASTLHTADFDGDGRVDVSSTASFWPGTGTFALLSPMFFATLGSHHAVGDMDRDGRPDIVNRSRTHVEVHLNLGPTTLSFAADGRTLGWPFDRYAVFHEFYRGTVSELIDSDFDGLPDEGYGVCLGEVPGARNEWVTVDQPTGHDGFFYLLDTVGPNGPSGLGTNSASQERFPTEICP